MKIPLSRVRQREILQRQINEVLLAISDANAFAALAEKAKEALK